jgi:hypothetical protein
VYVLCQNLHKVTEEIFLYKLSCDIVKSAYMIFVASNIIIFMSTSGYCYVMPKCTSGEFTLILSLLEILFPNL